MQFLIRTISVCQVQKYAVWLPRFGRWSPQGTKFGPLGFLAKFNGAVNLETTVNKVLSLKYVDDMTLVENCLNNHPTNIQSVLDKFSEWALQNHMKINPGKCCNMNVCLMKNIPRFPTLWILDTELEMTDCVKILGVLVSAQMGQTRWSYLSKG